MSGDYIGENKNQNLLFEALREKIELRNNSDWKHSSQYYIVYINSISKLHNKQLIEVLSKYPFFTGFADMTFSSRLKTILSTILVNICIKNKRTIIQQHEPGADDNENVNMSGYPFKEHGFNCKSINSDYYGLFLSYKIERPFQDNEDVSFSINSLGDHFASIDGLDLIIPSEKFNYLKDNKEGVMKKLGILDISPEGLQRLILSKLKYNYIYNMQYKPDYNVEMLGMKLRRR